MIKAFFIAIFTILMLMVLAYIVLPVMGGIVIATGALVWVVAGGVFSFCALIMAMFIVGGAGVLALAGIAALWLIFAIIFIPIAFPILLPLFILVLFITYARRNRKVIRNTDDK